MAPTLCYYLKSKMEKRFKPNRPSGFRGYYVEIRPGEDAVRAYRKIKRKMEKTKFCLHCYIVNLTMFHLCDPPVLTCETVFLSLAEFPTSYIMYQRTLMLYA